MTSVTKSFDGKLMEFFSRGLLMLSAFLLAQLWAKVDSLEADGEQRDRDLARYMIQIESRLTAVETRMED